MTNDSEAVTVDDYAKIANSVSDGYQAYTEMKRLSRGQPEGTLGRMLWEGFEQEKFNPAQFSESAWRDMASVGSAYDGALFLRFLGAVYERDKDHGRPRWAKNGGLPGWLRLFDNFLSTKAEDREFMETLSQRWCEVPAPHGHALIMKLAGRGVVNAAELPDRVIAWAARAYLPQHDFWNGSTWDGALCWDDETWSKALVDAGMSAEVERLGNPGLFATLAKSATPQQLVKLAEKTTANHRETLPSIEVLGQFGEAIIEPLEAALEKCDQFEINGFRSPYPAFHLVLGYCRACQVAGRVPDARFDEKIARFVSGYEPRWSKPGDTHYSEYHAQMRQVLRAIPEERLAEIMLTAENLCWELVDAAPTEEVARRVARALARMDDAGEFHFPKVRAETLNTFGANAVAGLCEVLEEGAGAQREAMIQALGTIGDDRAVKTLVAMLNDSTKGIREASKTSLLALSANAVVEHLGGALGGRRKDQRLAAAELLRALPASKEGYELARAHIDSEKVADVRAILEEIREPGDEEEVIASSLDPEKHEEIVEALFKSHGRDWKEFLDVGEGIAAAYFDFLAKYWHADTIRLGPERRAGFKGIIKAFPDSPLVRHMAIDVIGGLWEPIFSSVFDDVADIIDDIGVELCRALIEGRIRRHPAFGPGADYTDTVEPIHVLEWLLSRQPEHAWDAAVAGLKDSSRPYREACVAFVAKNPEKLNIEEDVVPLLAANTRDQRESGVRVLAELGQPEHLSHLQEALEREQTSSLEQLLRKTITRITIQSVDLSRFNDDEEGNVALDEKLSELPVEPVNAAMEKALEKIEAPRFVHGNASLSREALRWFVGELVVESREHCGGKVRQVRRRLVDEDCHAFCDALLEVAEGDEEGWPLYTQSIVGSAAHIESIGRRLEKFASSATYSWGDDAVETLVRSRSFVAARIMEEKAQSTRVNALRNRARSGVKRLAAAHNMSVDELSEAAMSTTTFGFDEKGAQHFDYGSRTITVRLSPQGDLVYEDDQGTRFKSMPQARKSDDEKLVKAARNEVSNLRRDLKRMRKIQTCRLEVSMTTRRRWILEVWRERYVEHPVMGAIASGLVWGLYDEADHLESSFFINDDGVLVDLDFEAPSIEKNVRIGLVHPLEFGEQRKAWLEALADHERVQPFEQLERPVFTKEKIDDVRKFLAIFRPVEPGTFLGRLNRRGYELGPRKDSGLAFSCSRVFGDYVVQFSHDGVAPESLADVDPIKIQDVSISYDDKPHNVSAVDSLLFSEVIHDIMVLMESDNA